MSKARKKLKAAAGKTAKRPKPRKSKEPFITRAEARRRAERHVLKRILNPMFKGARVKDGAEAGGNLYDVRRADTWVVYKNPRDLALRSSDVVVVCKRTGRVLYEGSACDEG